MPRKLDPKIVEVLKAYGFGPDACWDCHGVWVVYHRVLEQIAAQAGITFDPPVIIEADGANGIATICVTGHLKEQTVWSIGEASPNNNKNAYCWAMAEKRAKDRVVLKLIGLHGDVYSEEEADDFKGDKPKGGGQRFGGPLTITDLKKGMRAFAGDLAACEDYDSVVALVNNSKELLDQCIRDLPDWWYGKDDAEGAQRTIEKRKAELASKADELNVLGAA